MSSAYTVDYAQVLGDQFLALSVGRTIGTSTEPDVLLELELLGREVSVTARLTPDEATRLGLELLRAAGAPLSEADVVELVGLACEDRTR